MRVIAHVIPFPSAVALEQYAGLPFQERQAVELELAEEVYTERRDMIDTRAEKYAAKRAQQGQQQRAAQRKINFYLLSVSDVTGGTWDGTALGFCT